MNNRNDESNFGAWDDFTHCTSGGELAWTQVFDDYKAFRELFRSLPKSELIQRGWLESADDTSSFAQAFFSVCGNRSRALFRKSSSADDFLVSVWLALVRSRAEYTAVAHEVPVFETLAKNDLKSVGQLSVDIALLRELPARLEKQGIVLVYLRGLKGMKLDGAAFRLPSGHMVIGMTFRFPRLDYFWFTLMHELAHLVLHENVLERPIFVDVDEENNNASEKAANKLAKDSFVERTSWRNCEPKYQGGSDAVRKYALQQKVHPSIIAGLLRKEFGSFSRYNDIINEHDVRKLIFEL